MTRAEDVRQKYAGLVPPAAVERQAQAAVERHACCWEPVEGPHHPVCKNATDPDAPPPLIVGQESLI